MAGTAAQFIAQLEQRLGKPYSESIDGGVGPNYYDCSGLVMVCMDAIGINFTRTTYSQWADQRYQHLPPGIGMQLGDIVYMHVAGEADPGHVGVYTGNGEYINAPHTGAVVRIEAISDTAAEHPFGIIRPPFGSPAPVPPPPTPPTPQPAPPVIATLGGDMSEGPTVVDKSPADGNRHVFTDGSNGSSTGVWHWWQDPSGQGPEKYAWNCEFLNAAAT